MDEMKSLAVIDAWRAAERFAPHSSPDIERLTAGCAGYDIRCMQASIRIEYSLIYSMRIITTRLISLFALTGPSISWRGELEAGRTEAALGGWDETIDASFELYAYLDARELRSNCPALARVNRPGPAVERR